MLDDNQSILCWQEFNSPFCEDGKNHIRYYYENDNYVSEPITLGSDNELQMCFPNNQNEINLFSYLPGAGVGGYLIPNEDPSDDPSASGDLESLFKYIKVSDAGKEIWEESETLDPGEKFDTKVKFYLYTGTSNIEGKVKFYLSNDKHFDIDKDRYLGEDTFTLRPNEEEKEYWRGERAPDEDGNYYIFCQVIWDGGNSFYSNEYAKIEVRTPNYKPEGYFDTASCNNLSGWARDSNTTYPILVDIYADGPAGTGLFIGTTTANYYRADLPFASKTHGFSFDVPIYLKDDQIHSIYAYAIDSEGGENSVLINIPKQIKCVSMRTISSIVNKIILSDDDIAEVKVEGDVNCDKLINLSDAVSALKVMTNSNSGNICIESDVNDDSKIGLAEVIYVLQKISGIK